MLLLSIVAAIIIAVAFVGPWRSARRGAEPGHALSAAQARASNAAVPIEPRRRIASAPFRFVGGPAAREQAAECLATAAIYEAGDSLSGRGAVIQVVLNRVRTAGFPKTVCGVVYQGYARATGCQFSFTCDGSVERRTEHVGWDQARSAARRALAGYVDASVGGATHYHADWVVPSWRDSMTKVARVGPHLFYVPGRSAGRGGRRERSM